MPTATRPPITTAAFNTVTFDAENHVNPSTYISGNYHLRLRHAEPADLELAGNDGYLGECERLHVNIYTPSGQKLALIQSLRLTIQEQATPFWRPGSTSDQYFGSRRLAAMDQLGSAGYTFRRDLLSMGREQG